MNGKLFLQLILFNCIVFINCIVPGEWIPISPKDFDLTIPKLNDVYNNGTSSIYIVGKTSGIQNDFNGFSMWNGANWSNPFNSTVLNAPEFTIVTVGNSDVWLYASPKIYRVNTITKVITTIANSVTNVGAMHYIHPYIYISTNQNVPLQITTPAGPTNCDSFCKWNVTWTQFGNPNQNVMGMARNQSLLYFIGKFNAISPAPNVAAQNIARFNTANNAWSAVGPNNLPTILQNCSSITISGSKIYVANATRIVYLDLSITSPPWTLLTSNDYSSIFRLDSFQSTLFVMVQAFPFLLSYNGSTWTYPNGGPFFEEVTSLSGDVASNSVIIGGAMTTCATCLNNIAKLVPKGSYSESPPHNGSTFVPIYPRVVFPQIITSLAATDEKLFVIGGFTVMMTLDPIAGPSPAGCLAIYDFQNENWTTPNVLFNFIPEVVAVNQSSPSSVFIGGQFTSAGYNGTYFNSTRGIAFWNGNTIQSVGGGVNGHVYCMAINGSNLYVGGNFSQAGLTLTISFALFEADKGNWTSSGVFGPTSATYFTIVIYKDMVILGGKFTAGVFGNNLISWTKQNGFSPIAQWTPDNTVVALSLVNNFLFVGGYFTTIKSLSETLNISAFGLLDLSSYLWTDMLFPNTSFPVKSILYRRASSELLVSTVNTYETYAPIWRWNLSSNIWTNFTDDTNGFVYTMTSRPTDERVFVGGHWTHTGNDCNPNLSEYVTSSTPNEIISNTTGVPTVFTTSPPITSTTDTNFETNTNTNSNSNSNAILGGSSSSGSGFPIGLVVGVIVGVLVLCVVVGVVIFIVLRRRKSSSSSPPVSLPLESVTTSTNSAPTTQNQPTQYANASLVSQTTAQQEQKVPILTTPSSNPSTHANNTYAAVSLVKRESETYANAVTALQESSKGPTQQYNASMIRGSSILSESTKPLNEREKSQYAIPSSLY